MIRQYTELKNGNKFLDIHQEKDWIEKILDPTSEAIIAMPVQSEAYQRAYELRSYFLPILDQIKDELFRMERMKRKNKPSNNNKQK